MKRLLFILGATLTLAGVAAGVAWLQVFDLTPSDEVIPVSDAVTGVRAGDSFAYILRTDSGAILIDSGSDPDARAIVAALNARGLQPVQVRAILLTHGHRDHWRGAARFPAAPVYVADGDRTWIRGDEVPRALLPNLFSRLAGRPKKSPSLARLFPGSRLQLDGIELQVIGLPGHTPGSVAFLSNDVLFSGDSLLNDGAGIRPPPRVFSERPGIITAAWLRLRPFDFRMIADGHTGAAGAGRQRYDAWLSQEGQRGSARTERTATTAGNG